MAPCPAPAPVRAQVPRTPQSCAEHIASRATAAGNASVATSSATKPARPAATALSVSAPAPSRTRHLRRLQLQRRHPPTPRRIPQLRLPLLRASTVQLGVLLIARPVPEPSTRLNIRYHRSMALEGSPSLRMLLLPPCPRSTSSSPALPRHLCQMPRRSPSSLRSISFSSTMSRRPCSTP